MPAYLSPGVFVEEQDTGTRPIEAVGTSTAGFVGTAPIADAGKGDAVAVDNWGQFARIFVGDSTKSTDLANAVQGFFANGGSRCYIANIGPNDPIAPGLEALNLIDEIAILAAPGRTDQQSYSALLDAAETMKDRVAILDGPATVDDVEQLTRVGMVDDGGSAGGDNAGGKSKQPQQKPGLRPRVSDKGYGAFYFPWIRVADAVDPKQIVSAPPSGHMAGLWAQTDATRGVHKAPANLPIRGAVGLTKIVSRAEHDVLNDQGVNVIRFFSREGILVWGARTLADGASNWKYLNVRRLFAMIEESIAISTRWVIFEPNDRPLWNDLKRDISNFLRVIHSQGALAGERPEDAFFVKCDAETNPPETVDLGQVIVVVGLAPVKPAEFLIIRIGQSAAGTTVETA
jgi:phage tail sheath protein FI